MYVENKYLNLVDYANLFNNSIIRIGKVSADVGVEIVGLQEWICAFVLNYLLCNAIRQDEASRNGRRLQIAPYRFGCQSDLVVWSHFVRVLLEQGAVAFGHCRKDGKIEVVHVWHLRCLWLPEPVVFIAMIPDIVMKVAIRVWASVVPLENGERSFKATTLPDECLHLWEDLVPKQSLQSKLWFV